MTTAPNPHTIDIEDVRCGTCDEPAHYERQHRWAVKVCDRCRQTEDECECVEGEE